MALLFYPFICWTYNALLGTYLTLSHRYLEIIHKHQGCVIQLQHYIQYVYNVIHVSVKQLDRKANMKVGRDLNPRCSNWQPSLISPYILTSSHILQR